MRKNHILLFLIVFIGTNFFVNGQTVLINPTGDGGFVNGSTFASNGWTVANSANNPWVIGTAVTTSPMSGNVAYVSNNSGAANAYTVTTASVNYFYRDVTIPAGETKILLTFNWTCNGESTYDAWQLFIAPTSVTPTATTTSASTMTTTLIPAGVSGATFIAYGNLATTVQTANYVLPVSLAGTTFRLIFAWRNDASGGTAPPAAIDNISLTSAIPSPLSGGTYTINNTQPTSGSNFTSFTDFANKITQDGISGPVIANVVAGTGPYTEQVSFGVVNGSNSTNTVTVNGNGNILQYLSTNSIERATLKLNGSDYIKFDNLIIKSLGSTTTEFGYGVWLLNEANYNTINNCQILTDIATTSTNYSPLVSALFPSSPTTSALYKSSSNLTVSNCTIVGGYYGILLNGPNASPWSTTNVITNNEIRDFYTYGLYIRGQDNSVFSGNSIHRTNRTASTTAYMFYLNLNISNTSITKNKIYNFAGSGSTTSASYGIYATSVTSPANEGVLIANNAIYGYSLMNGTQYGIYLGTTGYARVYHNSVSMDYTSHTGSSAIYALYHTGANANLDIKNNVFAYTTNSTGAKYNMYFATNTAVVSSNNNVFYKGASAGTNNTGYWNSTAYNTLANWQAANGSIYDAQSVGENPAFTANNNLKPTSALIDNIGTDLSSVVTDDILGVPRSAFPDPGAYEYTPQVMSIDSVNVIQTVTASLGQSSTNNQMLRVGIYTQNSLNPLILNSISFSTNGSTNAANDIQNAKLWTSGTINSFTGATQIGDIIVNPNGLFSINNGTGLPMTLSPGNNYLWLTYDISGNATDQNLIDAELVDVNVSGTSYFPAISAPAGSRKIRVINGSYTVGTSGDFATLSEAFNEINSIGLAGNTTLNIISNITESSMLTLNEWAPSGNSYTLLIQPQGGAWTISGSVGTALLKLNGADRVTINGLNTGGNSLTFQNNSTATSTTVIWISSLGANAGATYNTIKNLNIIGGSATVTSQFGIYAAGTSVSTTGAGMDNDYLTLEGNNISTVYYGIYTRGNGSPNQTDYLLIKKNNITNYGLTGIHCYFADAPVFQENVLNSTVTSTSTKYGINVQNSTNAIKIFKNKIYVTLGTATSGSIHGINMTNDTATVSNPAYIWNNMISISGGVTQCYGIRDYQSHYNLVYNNSVNVTGTSTTDTRGINVAVGSTNVEVLNNNVLCNKYPIFIEKTNGVFAATVSNYNNLFSTGTGNQYAYHNGTAAVQLASLAALQADAAYAMDANSISVDPIYFSASDLHTENVSLMGMGTNLSWVTDDIDGEVRASIPCIGADEFTIPANDLLVKAVYSLSKLPIQGGSPHIVSAIIRNRGLATQTNINVSLNISGANSFNNVYTIASLAPGIEDTVNFAGFTPVSLGNNTLTVSLPSDAVLTNNSLSVGQEVTSNTFSFADNSSVTGGVGFGTGAGMLLTKYYINGSKQVYSTKVYIRGASSIGKEVYGVIINNAGVVLDTTAHRIISASDTSTWVTFNFIYPSTTLTTNNNVYVGLAQVANTTAYYPVGYQTESPLRRYTFYSNGSLSIINIGESSYKFMMEAVIGDPMAKDASITQIINPNSGCALNSQSITVKIKNEGTQTITPADGLVANYKIDNGSVVSQNVNVSIAPLATVDFTFSTQANLVAATNDVNYLLTSWVDLSVDGFKLNDTIRKVVTSSYVPPAPIANNAGVSYASSVTLTATPGSADTVIYWYQNIADTAFFFTGKNYTTPILYDTATYYIASGGGKANLKITEITTYRTGTGQTPTYPAWATGADLIEITNLGNASVNLLNYKFNIYGTGARNYTFPSIELGAGQILILCAGTGTDDFVNRYLNMGGSNDAISSGTSSGFVLYKPDNTVVDAAAIYNYNFLSGEASSSDWTGNTITTSGLAGIIRTISDNNTASDWVVSSASTTQTIGSLNPTLNVGTNSSTCQSARVPIKAIITNFPANEGGVFDLSLPSEIVNKGSNHPISFKLKNYGSANLNSAIINWSINGVLQTPFTWYGNILRQDTSSFVLLENHLFNNSGLDSIKAWIENPNGSPDNYNFNDTAYGVVKVNFSGEYTLGINGDYESISKTVSLLNIVGIGDNVTFKIKPGTYNEKLLINQIIGADNSKGVVLQSENLDETSVIISDSSLTSADNYTLRLNGADFITVKNLTIRNKGVTYGKAIDMLGGNNFVTISNNIIESSLTGTASTTAGIYSASGIDSNLVIENNIIKNGYYGIFLSGTSSTVKESNNIVRNNTLNDFYYYGIYSYYQNNTTISENYMLNRSTASTQYGISSYYNDNASITRNQIYLRGNGSGTVYGAYMYYNNNTSGNGLFANNMIAQANGTGSTYGIYNSNTKNTKFYYNSVSITKGTATIASNASYYNTGTTTGNKLLNNILSNTNGGYAAYFSSNTIDSTNYNCFYSTASNLVYWGSAAKADLIAYQSASGRDSKSVSFYPSYNDSINDLSLKPTSELVGIATTLPEVTNDVTGAIRGLYMPTIGAYELAEPVSRTLNLKLYLQGLHNGSSDMTPVQDDLGNGYKEAKYGDLVADLINIDIYDVNDLFVPVYSKTNFSLPIGGSFSLNDINKELNGTYYIVINHRNSIETWTVPVSFNKKTISYDLTTSASKAYGNNLVDVGGGVFAIYGGDNAKDGFVDIFDMIDVENDANNFVENYTLTDITGDGFTDIFDMIIVENNANLFVEVKRP